MAPPHLCNIYLREGCQLLRLVDFQVGQQELKCGKQMYYPFLLHFIKIKVSRQKSGLNFWLLASEFEKFFVKII